MQFFCIEHLKCTITETFKPLKHTKTLVYVLNLLVYVCVLWQENNIQCFFLYKYFIIKGPEHDHKCF